MRDIRMIATDIDGTLLPAGYARIPERVLCALRRALEAGIYVVPASGRMCSVIPEELMELPGVRYAISCNGAAVTDRKTGECIYSKRIPEDQAAELLRRLQKYDVYTCAYLPDGAYNWNRLHPGLAVHYSNRLPFFRQNPCEDLAAFVEEHGMPVEKIFVAVFSPEERDRVRREMGTLPGIHITSSSPRNLEINHIEADKGRALSWLSRHLGISAEHILALGDNENDYTMLTFAGTAVAPANATDVVRGIATEIVPDCARCGAAVCLERLLGEK